MYLERIEVTGYRGISRLTLDLNVQTVLIGENSWGKTSLLRGLWCLLGNGNIPYEFVQDDFYSDITDFNESNDSKYKYSRDRFLSFVLTFRERILGESHATKPLSDFKSIWVKSNDQYARIHYYVNGTMNKNGTVFTEHVFLDANGNVIKNVDDKLVMELIALNPVLRLRDGRTGFENYDDEGEETEEDFSSGIETREEKIYTRRNYSELEENITRLFRSYLNKDGNCISPSVIKDGIRSVEMLLEHYFTILPPLASKSNRIIRKFNKRDSYRSVKEIVSRPFANDAFNSLATLLKFSKNSTKRFFLAMIVGSLIESRGDRKISRYAKPILIFEDIESRLHPTVLLNLWQVIELLPVQKIVTTNSADLLSSIGLTDIRRIFRHKNITRSTSIDEKKFTNEELRKIAFHIRINRPMSLYARCWIFVEGETEIWLLNEFASMLGISLQAEGVRLVEYAQCGVAPLIKLAKQLGIEWLLLTDGDEAGYKYARHAVNAGNEDRVTILPSIDIEHFLYENGFENVYRRNTGEASLKGLNENKIIEIALKRNTKPGMALAIVDEARLIGKQSVPELFQKLFAKSLVKSNTS